ncbi:hypothetical protein U9M48_012277 [Paspalum notatum var. saurae]|uniref:Uncharacterized protein n=1 Tax=Paspalum notatum var. saurae TaxID=547442 RepID=A0AAQ3SX51_PASNO
MCLKGCLVLLALFETDLVETSAQIQAREARSGRQFIQQFINNGYGKLTLDSKSIEKSISTLEHSGSSGTEISGASRSSHISEIA